MPRIAHLRLSAFLIFALARAAAADDAVPDDFSFFQKEAAVVTPSLQPTSPTQSPATVYVVTAEDIHDSGAQTLWDVLRTVPGVDVMSERTSQGDVGIRGLNGPMNNNVLILLDGKTVLNGLFDSVDWEAIPVTLEEIDHIEVVEGPASALYGTNAVSGVINIITKTPEQLKGGVASYTGGERNTQMGSALIGDKIGSQAYKLDVGWRSTNMFSDASTQASAVAKADASYSLDLPDGGKWSVSGGIAEQDININNGPSYDEGQNGFLRTDIKDAGTSARLFWNFDDTAFRDHPTFPFNVDANTYDAEVEHAWDLPFQNGLTAGTSYRRNTASSEAFAPGVRTQDLFALFFEDTWRPVDHWSAVLSGRADHDSFTGWELSPRGSVIYAPVPNQSIRLTAASAFSNPALFDDYVALQGDTPFPLAPYTTLRFQIEHNPSLKPENVQFLETAYHGDFNRIKVTAAGFYYRLSNTIVSEPPTVTLAPPIFQVTDSLTNAGWTDALGGEVGGEYAVSRPLSTFANYSYESLHDQNPVQTTAHSAPRHKVNAGLKYKQAGWTAAVSGDWVDKTYWSDGSTPQNPVYDEVRGYVMLNVSARYRFSGKLEGLEAAVSGFNIADKHYEILPFQTAAATGQNGEIIGPRWSGTLSYRFGL